MRRLLGAVLAFVVISTAVDAAAEAPKNLEPLAFLLGTWEAAGGGRPGEAAGSATFAPGLQDRVIIRTSYAEYPAAGPTPASRHDDLMVIYLGEGGGIRADYYDNEGHVIRCSVTSPAAGEAVFVSDVSPGAPRFRLTYELGDKGILTGEFAIAPPGSPESFAQYLVWEALKAPAEGAKWR